MSKLEQRLPEKEQIQGCKAAQQQQACRIQAQAWVDKRLANQIKENWGSGDSWAAVVSCFGGFRVGGSMVGFPECLLCILASGALGRPFSDIPRLSAFVSALAGLFLARGLVP